MPTDRIAIVIVNWNTGALLAKCLRAIYDLTDKDLISQVIVVDNASHDDSMLQAEAAKNRTVPVTFIRSKENVGFAGGNNLGLATISETTDHILLLNPDTEVQSGAITVLLAALTTDPKAGIVGAGLHNPDGSIQASVRRFPTLGTFVWLFLKLHRLWPHAPSWQRYMMTDFSYQDGATVDQVMGAAFLIRNELYQEQGPLDDGYFVWFEEVDYSWQAKQRGWHTRYEPSAYVIHYGGVSFNQLVGLTRTQPWIMSCLRYAHKNLGGVAWLTLILIAPIALALAIPAGFVHRRRQRINRKDV